MKSDVNLMSTASPDVTPAASAERLPGRSASHIAASISTTAGASVSSSCDRSTKYGVKANSGAAKYAGRSPNARRVKRKPKGTTSALRIA